MSKKFKVLVLGFSLSFGLLAKAEAIKNNSSMSERQYARALCRVVTATPSAANTPELTNCLLSLNQRHSQAAFKNIFEIAAHVCELPGTIYESKVSCYRNAVGLLQNNDFANFTHVNCDLKIAPQWLSECYRKIFVEQINEGNVGK